MKPCLYLVLVALGIQTARASHLLGGYVQAKSVSGLTYEFTAVIYMHAVGEASQLNSLSVCLGDGNVTTARRVNYQLFSADKSISVSTYQLVYTYTGPGVYTAAVSMPGRTSAKNSSTANNQAFTLTTTFTTNTARTNKTPAAIFPDSSFRATTGQRLALLLKATDSEGDSLAYALATPFTSNGTDLCRYQPVTNFTRPNELTRQGIFTLNNRTGELVWDAPVEAGTYNIVLTIYEYRNGVLISQTTQEINVMVDSRTIVTAAEPDADLNLTVFPNPADDRLQVVVRSNNPAPATIQLLALNGQLVHESVVTKAARQHEQFISLLRLVPGVYLVSVSSGGRSLVRRLVKK